MTSDEQPPATATFSVVPAETPKKPSRPSFLVSALLGALTGSAFSMLIAPAVISWWYEPGDERSIACVAPFRQALSAFVWAQISMTVVVAVLFLVVAGLIRRRRRTSG